MTLATRETVTQALFTLLQKAMTFKTSSRRLQITEDVSSVDKPAMFLVCHKETHVKGKSMAPAIRTLEYVAWFFIDTGLDPNVLPDTELNALIDSIDPSTGGVLAPAGGTLQQTLGGLVTNCYIDGEIIRVPGDVDGNGLAVVPIKVVYM